MSSPPVQYSRQANFAAYETTSPTLPKRGTDLDAEFNAIVQSLVATIQRLGEIQRDDGKLLNAVVTPEAFSTTALAIMAGSWYPRGSWAAGMAYAVSDVVSFSDVAYVCTAAHTAGVDFLTDKAAGKWLSFFAPGSASSITFNPAANIAATNVQAAIEEAATDAAAALSTTNATVAANGTAILSLEATTAKVVGSLTALRALDKTVYGFAVLSTGAGLFRYDSTDTTSGDNGVSTIVATDGGRWKRIFEYRQQAKANGATSIDASAGGQIKCADVATTTVATITNGYPGQRITLIFTNGNTTIANGGTSNIRLAGAANFVGTADDTLQLESDGVSWFETSRSVN